MAASFEKTDVVVLSSIDWDAAWQRHQIFASRWAKAGHRVFFVENLGFRNPGFSDWRRLAGRLQRLAAPRPSGAGRPQPGGLKVVSPAVLPPTQGAFRRLNAAVLGPRLVQRLRAEGLEGSPVVVAYLPTATTIALLDELTPSVVIYDCVDNFAGHPSTPRDLARTESALLSRADLVLTTSSTLFAEKSRQHGRVRELHQGAPDEFFIDAPLKTTHKKFCYYGTIWSALDYEAIGALAGAGFDVELIGPQKEPPPALPPRVRLRPELSHEKLPLALREHDALILPYRKSDYNKGVAPAKLYECLATGLPVLSSPLPALEGFEGALIFADGPDEWIAAARALDRTDSANARSARIKLASEHRQERTFAALRDEARSLWSTPGRFSRRAPEPTRTRAFVRGFAWLGASYAAAQVLVWLTLVLAARWLGAERFGLAALALAAAAVLRVPPALGFPLSLGRSLASELDESRQARLVATGLLLFLLVAAAWLTALTGARERLSDLLGISEDVFDPAILAGYGSALGLVGSSPLLGLGKFARRGALELVGAAVFSACFPLFLSLGRSGDEALVLAAAAGSGAAGLLSIVTLLPRLRPALDGKAAFCALKAAAPSAFQLAGSALVLAAPPLILNHVEPRASIGVYAVYFLASVLPALAFGRALGSAAGAVAERPEEGAPWLSLGWRAAPLCFGAGAAAFVSTCAALAVAGAQYPLSGRVAGEFALAAALCALHGAVAARSAGAGPAGLWLASAGELVAGLAAAWLSWTLIPSYSLLGAAAALAGGYGASLLFFGALEGRRRLA